MATIQEKKDEVMSKLQTLVTNHNELVEEKTKLYNEIIELQGAIKALNDLEE
tara:strand:+ start:367 stop:522 length:156 start_codon:yes stop_codon:yes gene_type:complete